MSFLTLGLCGLRIRISGRGTLFWAPRNVAEEDECCGNPLEEEGFEIPAFDVIGGASVDLVSLIRSGLTRLVSVGYVAYISDALELSKTARRKA